MHDIVGCLLGGVSEQMRVSRAGLGRRRPHLPVYTTFFSLDEFSGVSFISVPHVPRGRYMYDRGIDNIGVAQTVCVYL